MVQKKSETQSLQNRINELERQLAKAQSLVHALQAKGGQSPSSKSLEASFDISFSHEDGYKRVLQVAPYPLMIWREDGRIMMVNAAFTEISGYNLEDIPTIEDWSHKAFADRFLEQPSFIFYEELPGKEVKKSREFEVTTRTGEKRIWDFSYAVLGNDQEERWLMITMAVDITERRQIEQQLEENELKFTLIFDKAPFAAALSKLPEGVITLINEEFERVFGYTRHEVLGKTSIEIGINPDPESRAQMLLQIQTSGSARNVETQLQTKSGEVRTFLLNLDQVSIEGEKYIHQTAQDITESKKAEEALQRFQLLSEHSRDIILFIRFQDGRILEANAAAVQAYGYSHAELLELTISGLRGAGSSKLTAEQMVQANETGILFETIHRRKDGSCFPVEVSSQGATIGGVRTLVSIVRDITERKQAEERIVYQANLLASVNDAIVGSDAEFHLTAWNRAAESIYGWMAEEVLGRNGLEILRTQWPQERAEEMRQRIAETGRWRGEASQIRKDGTRIPVEVSSMVLRNEQGHITGYVSVNRDITERKNVERALKASDAKMRAVFRALTEGVVFLNRDGEVEEANDAVQLSFDHTIEELSDPELDPRTMIIRPDGTPFPVEEQPAIVALRTGKIVRDVELGVPTRDGKISWRLVNAQPVLDDQGNLLGAVASFFDITERKIAEQALRESEQRFRSLADSMPQLVWTALPDGRVDYYNERHLEYHDIKQSQSTDWDWAPVLHRDDMQVTVDAWLRSIETGEIYQIEHRIRINDGSYRWHLSRGLPMLDEQGQIIRWFGTATDIHDLKMAEVQLKINASRLEKSNRELEQFAFMASHDLQEPLRKIEMFGDLLLERATNIQENERMYLDRMRSAAGRMRAMIEGLLQISRIATQAKPFVRVDLSKVTQDVLSDLEHQIKDSGGRVEVGRLPVVYGDPLQLRQLMQNLIGNALKYSQPGKHPEVEILAEKLPEKVLLYVKDKGIGFSQADAERIFEPFQRLVGRNEYEGSGIGLAICRRIVERHGGEIAAISEPGQGANFIVTLPNPSTKKYHKRSLKGLQK